MRLFGRRAEAPARPALVRAPLGLGVGGAGPRSYEAQVADAYLGNAIAQRSVRIVAEGAAGVPVYASAGPEQAVGLIAAPLVETIAAHLLLHGNAFVQIVTDSEGAPAELYPLRPERVTIEQDARGWPVAYLYRAGAAGTRVPAFDGAGRPGLVHLKSLHPTDDLYGAGALGAAQAAVAVHNAAGKWNKALLDNAARPSGALVFDGGESGALSRDQYERLKAEVEAGFAGAANAGRPMLLEGGLSWQAMSLTPADMDFAGLKAGAAREIALASGCRRCCSGCRATIPTPIIRRRTARCGG